MDFSVSHPSSTPSQSGQSTHAHAPAIETPDLSEKGRPIDGKPQTSDRRLYMQLLVFTKVKDMESLISHLSDSPLNHVLYEDLNDARGVGLLTMSDEPGDFVGQLRQKLNHGPFAKLKPRHKLTMFGRTYSLGYEADLHETLFDRPTHTALNPDWPWAVWYPLRRNGAFMKVEAEKQRQILMEHAIIGRSFGQADLAHDIRLVCNGLDYHDNDFVIGLTGRELFPLSAIVQAMRKTDQTSQYVDQMGPFFVGKVAWRYQAKS